MNRPASTPRLVVAFACALVGLAAAPSRAEVVDAGAPAALAATTTLLSESVLTRGSQSFSFELRAPSAGTFDIRLADLGWPERLASLSFSLANSSGVLRTLQGAGTLSVQVGTAGAFFANVATRTQGSLGAGLFGLDVRFTDSSVPVPLPPAAWLMVAAAATLAGLLHRGARPHEPGGLAASPA